MSLTRALALPMSSMVLYSAQAQEIEMLDAFIIDKIRRERESRDSARVPLRIEVPRPHGQPLEDGRPVHQPEDEERERGVAIIDFTI